MVLHMTIMKFIKELTEEFDGQYQYLEETTEKYITFSVPIKK